MSELDDMMKADLERSGITMDEAEHAYMYAVNDATTVCPSFQPLPAIVIPYVKPLDDVSMMYGDEEFARVRYLDAPVTRGFVQQKAVRYGQPPESGTHPYFPVVENFTWQEVFDDIDTPIFITEGEKKALAACLEGFPTIGLGGVYNFMNAGEFLPDVANIEWAGRIAYICFDSDAATNPQIQAAEGRLATELSLRQDALVKLVRIPNGVGNAKIGIDDYLVEHGGDHFAALVDGAHEMRTIDRLVLGLNEKVCWIESEGMIYETGTKKFIVKANFTCGSKYSALETYVPTAKGDKLKRMSIAGEWLVHPLAERYDQILFHPGAGRVLDGDHGGTAINMWTGWEQEEGDVEPFLELTEFLLSETDEKCANIVIKLLAYKMQNPMKKVPMAIVFVGTQGCGKSLWCNIVRNTTNPYSAEIYPSSLSSDFNPWVENTMFVLLNEATGPEMERNAEKFKTLIDSPIVQMNDKYRPARQVKSFTFYLVTSNNREIAKFDGDDRRMVVIAAPKKREGEFYRRIGDWYDNGGSKKLMHYLLNYDLEGWAPPAKAPETAEKHIAFRENLSAIEIVAEDIAEGGANMIEMWIAGALNWARENETSSNSGIAKEAKDRISMLPLIPIRPFYTADELALMFPSVVSDLYRAKYQRATTAGTISKDLRNAGITYLRSKDSFKGFKVKGLYKQFLIVSSQDEFKTPISQAEFERIMREAPAYADLQEP